MSTELRPGIVLLALVCGLPLSFMAVYGLPWMLVTSVAMLYTGPMANAIHGIVLAAASLLALATYWRLALATAADRKFRFGGWFWLALACAALASYEFDKWFGGPEASLLLIAPMVLSTVYFIYKQRVVVGG